jgi:hypothetical protein
MAQQYAAGAGVLTQYHIGIAQHIYRTVGYVTKVADRRWNEVQAHYRVKCKKLGSKNTPVAVLILLL